MFDLDGTLCDPGPGITESIKFALSEVGIIEDDYEKLKAFVGPPLNHTFAAQYGMNENEISRVTSLYRKRFAEEGIHHYSPYPGIKTLLDKLSEKGTELIVATSKIEPFAREILRSTDLIKYFSFLSTNLPRHPEDKEVTIARALNHYGKKISRAVMIGDKEHDVIGAKANGIDSIGVLWGYGSLEEIQRIAPTHMIRNVEELQIILK